ncbi:MAG TPA: ATP-binding protein [Verrucomicrobiae bacterium]|nr:ATP-binding protein [Verrucomicrobiae bacterium]
MKTSSGQRTDVNLQRQRESIRRGLLRANAAAATILLVVIGLALAAILHSNRAEGERVRAVEAQRDAAEKLWHSLLAQARAGRNSGQAGQRFESLEAIRLAAALQPSLELRNEAVACLALADLRLTHPPFATNVSKLSVDHKMERYALADAHENILVRSITNDQLLQQLPGLNSAVVFIHHFSPNGRYLPVHYRDGQMRVWDLAIPKIVLTVRPEDSQHSVEFSPDSSKFIAVEATQQISLHDISSGKLIRRESVSSRDLRPRFSPDGRRVSMVSPGSNRARIVGTEDGKALSELPHESETRGLRVSDWSPDGQFLATGSNEGRVYIWRPPHSQPVFVLSGHQGSVNSVAFHPSGRLLASASWDGTLRLWDAITSEPVVTLPATGNLLRFSPDGRHLSFYWGKEPRLHICEVAADRICRFLGPRAPRQKDKGISETYHQCVAYSPDGKFLATGGNVWRLWNVETEAELTHGGQASLGAVYSVFFHPTQRSLMTFGEQGLFSWPLDAIVNSNATNLPAPLCLADSGGRDRACISADGRELAFIRSSAIHLLHSKQKLEGPAGLTYIAMSQDGRWLAGSAWYNQGGRLWELPSGRHVRDFSKGQSVGIGFSRDSRWLVTGESDAYRFWNPETGRLERQIDRGLTTDFLGVFEFSPDGGIFACTQSRTRLQLFDGTSFDELTVLDSPTKQMVAWLAFNGRNGQLAVATATPYVQIWDLPLMRRELASLGLDWGTNAPSPYESKADGASTTASRSASPKHLAPPLVGIPGSRSFVASRWLPLGGVVLAIGLAIFVFKRQQNLVVAYRQIDELAVENRQALDAAQTALLHSEKMRALGMLAAGIAHDFNNLLSVIRMANQLVERAVRPTGVTKENIDAIEHAVVEGQQIVRCMLGYSRDASNRDQKVMIGELVSETVALLSKRFLSGIVLTLELDPRTPSVNGSKARLEQILLNLVVNAVEAMNGQGKLRISVSPCQAAGVCLLPPRAVAHYIELILADYGPGIPADVLPHIFEPFFTTKTKGASHGTGLGLSTVYTIAEQDGLGLDVTTQLGMGSVFRVLIPAD